MASTGTFISTSNQLTRSSVIVAPTFASNSFGCSVNLAKVVSFRCVHYVRQWSGRSRMFSLSTARLESWEDPDDGSESGSEYESEEDENDEGEEIDEDFERHWEGEIGTLVNHSIVDNLSPRELEEDLMKEVEQLLSPEEKAILQNNEIAAMEKISTEKWNPLHTFALAGQIKSMDKLFDNGVHVDLVDKDGLTALHHATIGKKEPVISHLLRKGANPQARDLDGATPLHYAVQVGAMQTVKLLIKYNVDVNAADNEGWTPLHIAMQSRNRDIAKILLVSGAESLRKNKDGKTPLDLSLCYGKDFKSYDLSKLLKLVTAKRDI